MRKKYVFMKYDAKPTSTVRETRSELGGVAPKCMGSIKGEKVLIKSYNNEQTECLAEFFAYKLGTYLGLNINKVRLIDCGELFGLTKICSAHYWENKFVRNHDTGRVFSQQERNIMYLFDTIIENSDRHGGNYGELDGELFLIDNGYSHPWKKLKERDKDFFKAKVGDLDDDGRDILLRLSDLTAIELEKMFDMPKSIKAVYKTRIEEIVIRILDIQETIKEALQEVAA